MTVKNIHGKRSKPGAVGRMKVDDNLLKLIDKISGRLQVEKYGTFIIDLLKKCYSKGATIEEATFLFVHELFKRIRIINSSA